MINLKFKLSEHPFYKLWESGQVSLNKLSEYGYSYLEFISKIPEYWQKVIHSFSIPENWIVNEEKEHIELWKKWINNLEKPKTYPKLNDLIEFYDSLNPSALLGGLNAFEIQQPEISKIKKDCLIKFYNFKEEDLIYFDEHLKEEKHISFGIYIYENFSNKEDFLYGFEKGSEMLYKSLDNFL